MSDVASNGFVIPGALITTLTHRPKPESEPGSESESQSGSGSDMDDRPPQYLFKETRVDLEPDTPTSVVVVPLPGQDRLAALSSRILPRRQQSTAHAASIAEDETTFVKDHLASAASLFFRQNDVYPRSVLWRVLSARRTLAVRFVDFTRDPKDEPEAPLELRFVFSDTIRPAAVSIAEDEATETLVVFVLTTSNDLYTIPLRPDTFRETARSQKDTPTSWCQIYRSPSFAFRYPHRLVARSAQELVVTLHDGGLLRLTRQAGEDGSAWKETFNNEGGWGSSLRNLIPWQGNHTVSYGNVSLEETTLTSLAFSPSSDADDYNLIFGVSLDHRLKAWNLSTGRMESSRDLCNGERQPHDGARYAIDPSYTDLVTVLDQKPRRAGYICYLATFSPLKNGEFKFWAVVEGASGPELRDLHAGSKLEPVPPSSDLWAMAQFRVVPSEEQDKLELWVLWKNNTSYQVEMLKFDLLNACEGWGERRAWTTTETLRETPLPTMTENMKADPTQAWMDHIFYPGRFTRATLLTALSIYERGVHLPSGSAVKGHSSLEERICSSVASSVVPGRNSKGQMDYRRFQMDVDVQWRRYYRIIAELDKQRGEAISLVYDTHGRMPWIVNADGVTPVRQCNELELIWHNGTELVTGQANLVRDSLMTTLDLQYQDDVGKIAGLITAASTFSECFSETLMQSCMAALEFEVLQDSSDTVATRIRSFYDRCKFEQSISDDDYSQLATAMDQIGGFSALTTELFQSVMEIVLQRKSSQTSGLKLTLFGEKTIVRGAQETIQLTGNILADLLYLLVFVEIEERQQEGSEISFDTPTVFLDLVRLLRQYAVLRWFGKTTRLEQTRGGGQDSRSEMIQANGSSSETSVQAPRVSTVLQNPWIHNWKPIWVEGDPPMSSNLTTYINEALAGIELSDPEQYGQQVMWLQRTFLRRGETDLAMAFLPYQPIGSWSEYITARLYLSVGQYALARIHFRRAAYQLAHREGGSLAVNATDDLLSREIERYFNAGLPSYYLHIAQLYDEKQAYSFVSEFAYTGMIFLSHYTKKDKLQRQRALLNLGFNASLKTGCFDEAYSDIMRCPDKTLQRTFVEQLITTMTSSGESAQLITFPFLGVRDIVEEILFEKAKEEHHLQRQNQQHHQLQVRPPRVIDGGSTSTTDPTNTKHPSYDTILYAFRLRHRDFRGAAMALYERLEFIKSSPSTSFISASTTKRVTGNTTTSAKGIATTSKGSRNDTTATNTQEDNEETRNKLVTRTYLALINLLAAMDPEHAWFIVDLSSSSKRDVSQSMTNGNGNDSSLMDDSSKGSPRKSFYLVYYLFIPFFL
ncbi:MAG: hypothetical protein M1823_001756 [Watsoniomyces obsoletus]|nr:MAG: hypothetical protein M1823_001756 [Watsoniomyces obsoletus]